MELGQTPPTMPSSRARNCLSTPKGFPASAPGPQPQAHQVSTWCTDSMRAQPWPQHPVLIRSLAQSSLLEQF